MRPFIQLLCFHLPGKAQIANRLAGTICIYLLFFCSHAQSNNFNVIAHFTNENGLPQNSINSLLQDDHGFIWLTTYSGIVRFDGQNCRLYQTENMPAMRNNSYSYQRINKGVHEIAPAVYGQDILTLNGSRIEVVPKTNSMCYVTTHNKEFTDFGGQVPPFLVRFFPLIDSQQKRVSLGIGYNDNFICWPGKQDGYFRTNTGEIWYYNGEKGVKCSVGNMNNMQWFLIGSKLYVITNGNKLMMWENGISKGLISGSFPALLQANGVAALFGAYFICSKDQIFFLMGERLYKIEEKNGLIESALLTDRITMPNPTAVLYLPHENLLAIGTTSNGLYILRKRVFSTLQYEYPKKFSTGYSKNSLYAVVPIDDTTVVTTTGSLTLQNVSHVNSSASRWNLRILLRLKDGSLIADDNGRLYQTSSTFEHPQLLKSLPAGSLQTYLLDEDTIYLAIENRLVKTVYTNGNFTTPELLTTLPASFTALAKGQPKELIVGTKQGLFKLRLQTKQVQTVPDFEKKFIRCIYKSKHNGDMWIGTNDYGWYRYNESGVVKMPLDPKRYLLSIHAFAEDKKGYLWASTNNGMFRFFYSDMQAIQSANQPFFYNYFDNTYGSLTSEYNGNCTPAMAYMPNGSFVFPSIQGLVHFYPDSIEVEQSKGNVVVEDLYEDNILLNTANPMLHAGFNSLDLHMSIPFFGHRYNLIIEYRLSGGSDNWTKLPENGIIHFNRLTPGSYTLSIRSLSGYNTGNKMVTTNFVFEVDKYWYQSIWLYIGGIILLALGVFWYIRRMQKISNLQKRKLEAEVQDRTRDLHLALQTIERNVDELKESEAKLKQSTQFKEQITALVLHDIRSPLMFLDSITTNIYNSTEHVVPNPIRKKLFDLNLGVKEISAFAHGLLTWINVQQEESVVKKTMVNISSMLQEKITYLKPLAVEKGIDLGFECEGGTDFYIQPELLKILLRNLIDNAIKYTSEGWVKVAVSLKDEQLFITVSDTGAGMSLGTIQQLLNDEQEPLVVGKHSGLGYRFIKDMLKKMDGQINIESEVDRGTTVMLRFFK